MMDPLDPLYNQAPGFTAQRGDLFWIVSDEEGRGVVLDDPVYDVWAAFDGRSTDLVLEELCGEAGVTSRFVESTAKVLARAGVLQTSQPLGSLNLASGSSRPTPSSSPLVSVIIVAGREARGHLESCLPSVLGQTYPNLEVMLVDNQTTDDSAAYVRSTFPEIDVIRLSQSVGFGAANNLAMEQARGELFFLLNDDTEMEPHCVAECVRAMAQSGSIAAVVPKMKLFYLRDFINSMGTSVHANGISYDNFTGYLDVGQFDETDQVFTACFGAVLLRGSVVDEIGDIDEAYVYYYEDSDWSFRARVAGYDIVAAPGATVYHKFNATMNTLPSAFKARLVTRNRLRFIWKNVDLGRALRFTRLYRDEDCRRIALAVKRGEEEVAKAYRRGWREWLFSLPGLALTRCRTRRLRKTIFDDDAAFELAGDMPPPAMHGPYPVISRSLIRNHYMQLERFKPSSSAPTGDTPVVSRAKALDAPSILQVTRDVLREKGVRGLMEQAWRYLRC